MRELALPASFRDPSGFVFEKEGTVYRQVNRTYKDQYEMFLRSGLYQALTDKQLLVKHEEVPPVVDIGDSPYKVLRPEQIPFISYPYEWSFSQLKDAALLTLEITQTSLKHGMILKDASAYNVQFLGPRPVFIDTLSFEPYVEGKAWTAYRQFCQHFLGPLALMAKVDVRLASLLKNYIDGVPLDLASRLLPKSTYLSPSLLMHIHLHARAQGYYSDKGGEVSQTKQRGLSKFGLASLIDSLSGAVKSLKWQPPKTEWGAYYSATNYSEKSFDAKKQLVEGFIKKAPVTGKKLALDLGGNTGVFSRLACGAYAYVVSADIDPVAVECNYRNAVTKGEKHILPLIIDLSNPSPSVGWSNEERPKFKSRKSADLVMALALIHHLAISNNLPLEKIARFFSEVGQCLILEFVPKEDSQVRRLLTSREDIFPDYHLQGFEAAFSRYFTIIDKQPVEGSLRTLYLLRRLA